MNKIKIFRYSYSHNCFEACFQTLEHYSTNPQPYAILVLREGQSEEETK